MISFERRGDFFSGYSYQSMVVTMTSKSGFLQLIDQKCQDNRLWLLR